MNKSSLLKGFNNHFEEFIDSIYEVFPDDADILASRNILKQIRKANPKLIVKVWKTYVVDKYDNEISSGNINFFIEKDYVNDVNEMDSSSKILEGINRLRDPIRNMGEKNQKTSMKYIQNLSQLTKLYLA